jgi:hypothetical protein
MNIVTTAEALRTYFLTAWAISSFSSIDVVQEDTIKNPTSGETWIRMSVAMLYRRAVSYGTVKTWRTDGAVFFQIFTPTGSGDGVPRAIADVIGGILEGKVISGISVQAVTYEGNIGDDGSSNQYNVRVDYTVDELK